MKTIPVTAITALFLLCGCVAHAADAPGKALFLKNQCNKCHEVTAEGITPLPPAPPAPGEDDPGPIKIRDLSGVGKTKDAAFFKDFLQKKADADDGKKHPKKFKGTDEELGQVVDWITSLKTDPAKKP
jgi:mono/diheme cytochrome c family protein